MQIPAELVKEYNLNPEWECYDNSTLNIIDSCIRKAYWKLEFTIPGASFTGIQDRVGIAGHFGTCIHSAMDKYYSPILHNTYSQQKRKIAAFRAFSAKYAAIIPQPELVENPYTHDCGVALLDDYFSHYEEEDNLYRPIETELCVVVPLKELNPPAYWISRIDGVIERPAMGDYLVREYKTTKSSIQNKLDELRISRQPEGYVWSLRQPKFKPEKPITGVMADILAVRVRERDFSKLFRRDIFHINEMQAEIWRRETMLKIQRWREIRRKAYDNNSAPLIQHHFFDRNTNECLRYGKCSYYDLCVYGLNGVDLNKFFPNDWNPLHAEKVVDMT